MPWNSQYELHDNFLYLCYGTWQEHPCTVCMRVCVCSGESSTGQRCLLPWVTRSRYPTSPCNLFLPTSLPYPLPPPPAPPLLFPLWLTDESYPTTNDITTPSLTLCCGESYCTLRFSLLLSSANQRGEPECHPFIHKNQTQVKWLLGRAVTLAVTSTLAYMEWCKQRD